MSYDDVYSCLVELSRKAEKNGDYYLAFSRICCDTDRLDWNVILQIILHIFGNDFNIMLF